MTPAPRPDSVKQGKGRIRQKMLDIMAQVQDDLREMASLGIWSILRDDPHFIQAKTVAAFASTRREIDTYPLLEGLLAQGKTLLLPRILADGKNLSFHEVKNLKDLVQGEYDIPTPPPHHPLGLDAADLVLVPGLAFDRRGYRVGYGKGFYDRALPRLRKEAVSIGLCYSFQVTDALPIGRWDVPVRMILTEKSLETCRK